jgi:hypothetical protein
MPRGKQRKLVLTRLSQDLSRIEQSLGYRERPARDGVRAPKRESMRGSRKTKRQWPKVAGTKLEGAYPARTCSTAPARHLPTCGPTASQWSRANGFRRSEASLIVKVVAVQVVGVLVAGDAR